jgi:hypothetical protein
MNQSHFSARPKEKILRSRYKSEKNELDQNVRFVYVSVRRDGEEYQQATTAAATSGQR